MNPSDLLKLKELLDQGVLTQEEFDAQKRRMLGVHTPPSTEARNTTPPFLNAGMKIYPIIFLGTGIPFGLYGLLKGTLERELSHGIKMGLIMGGLFGFFMATILGTMHRQMVKRFATEDGDCVGPRQSQTVIVKGSYEAIFDACLQALKQINANIKTSDRSIGSIVAKTSLTWRSFGEELEVTLIKQNDEQVQVTISSSPIIKTTLIDYGKGLKNVTSFLDALEA